MGWREDGREERGGGWDGGRMGGKREREDGREGREDGMEGGWDGGRMGGKGGRREGREEGREGRMGKKEIVRRRKIDVGEINIEKRQAIFDGQDLYKELGKNNRNQEY